MTPEQANLAATFLLIHAPSDPDGYAANLAAREHLLQFGHAALWLYDPATRTLVAADPAGRERSILNVSDFAQDVALAWRSYPEHVRLDGAVMFNDATYDRLKSRRNGLAKRLDARHMHALARAVRDVRLAPRDDTVIAQYAPEGVPLRFDFK
ncbi:MAG: hypothetical protein HZY77_16265 [Thiobacillus sp.]|uniref:hypothetical protein n=1 Tax=Thiobacillus sp. TaxID=924 RepID=UPI00168C9C76|nr:hypothetical protein [Thiobacillus sp.]QLQ04089.1 MAG: hypothetical protein HZY77_16265 [Thiobacillus sp.]